MPLFYGASKIDRQVLLLSEERLGLTVAAGLLAIALTVLVTRRQPAPASA